MSTAHGLQKFDLLDDDDDDSESLSDEGPLRKEVLQLAWALEKRLRRYESRLGKGCWKDDDAWTLFHRMMQESTKVSSLLVSHKYQPMDRKMFLDRVANTTMYALFLCDVMHGLMESDPPEDK